MIRTTSMLMLCAALLNACGSSSPHRASSSRQPVSARVPGYNALPDAGAESARRAQASLRWEGADPAAQDQALGAARSQVVVTAVSMIGTPYRWGGNDPSAGLDCSGLVSLVYRSAANVALPRTSRQMSQEGAPVRPGALRPGDLVFFNTVGRFSHVGIYVGEGRFVHSPSSGGKVRLESLDSKYWTQRYDSARRLIASSTSPRPEIASRR